VPKNLTTFLDAHDLKKSKVTNRRAKIRKMRFIDMVFARREVLMQKSSLGVRS